MTKLQSYKTVIADLVVVRTEMKALELLIDKFEHIHVSSSVVIKSDSSDAQFIFAIGILNAQILACKELGIDPVEKQDKKKACLQIRTLARELDNWETFEDELVTYHNQVFNLLTEKEKFSLLEYPKKKK